MPPLAFLVRSSPSTRVFDRTPAIELLSRDHLLLLKPPLGSTSVFAKMFGAFLLIRVGCWFVVVLWRHILILR